MSCTMCKIIHKINQPPFQIITIVCRSPALVVAAIIFLLNNEERGDGNSDHELGKKTLKERLFNNIFFSFTRV